MMRKLVLVAALTLAPLATAAAQEERGGWAKPWIAANPAQQGMG